MKERPILMSAPMVKAILADQKTQTRRVVKPQPMLHKFTDTEVPAFVGKQCAPGFLAIGVSVVSRDGNSGMVKCPYGQVGDRLWVKESWRTRLGWDKLSPVNLPIGREINNPDDWEWLRDSHIDFEAGENNGSTRLHGKLRPSIFMRRWMSRITLEVTGVRVERLNDISESDACWEGIDIPTDHDYIAEYRRLWESINGKGSWALNPWVWVIEFRRVEP